MALLETKRFVIHIVTDASKVNPNLAAALLITFKQIINQADYQVRLKCLDKSLKHGLHRNRLLLSIPVSRPHCFEERNDEIETAAPQGRVDLKYPLQGCFIPSFDKKGEAKLS
jgi:hypothetical protein